MKNLTDLAERYQSVKAQAQDYKWGAAEYAEFGDHKESERLYAIADELYTELARIKTLMDAAA